MASSVTVIVKKLLEEIRACRYCAGSLPHEPRPVLHLDERSKILIIGQAPGKKVHESGVPWDDKSGERLRDWLGVTKEQFYDTSVFGILPMGFCYPGKGRSGDLPPRPECSLQWHSRIRPRLRNVRLSLLIGAYAQNYYLGTKAGSGLTETVKNYRDYLPEYFPLVHPSPQIVNAKLDKLNRLFKKQQWDLVKKKPLVRRGSGAAIEKDH